MMPRKRTFRRFLPLLVCLILLRMYVVREGGGVYPDEGQERRSQLAEAFPQDVGRRPFKEGVVAPEVTGTESSQSQSGEGRLGEAPLSSVSVDYQAPELPLRYRTRESDLLMTYSKRSDGRRNISGAAHDKRVLDAISGWSPPLWLQITNDLYTYSAFWDDRPGLAAGPVARVIGVLRYHQELVQGVAYSWTGQVKDHMLNCSCLLWYKHQEEPEEGTLKAFIFEEGLKVFVGTYFLCHPQAPGAGSREGNFSSTSGSSNAQGSTRHFVPYAVSLVPQDTVSASHKLIYLSNNKRPSSGSTANRNLTTGVCVRPLYGPYGDLQGMTQFIAYYHTVLGVSHFYFYDLAVSIKVKDLLKLFVAAGEVVVQLLPWNLPTTKWHELWDLGSLAALNDCVYRNSGRHRYVAVVDLDEFIVPRAPATGLAHLYHNVLKHKKGQEGDAALILNAFFCYEFKDLVYRENDTFPIFHFNRREARVWPPKSRSKMILIPEYIVSVGHHMVHNFLLNTSKNHGSPKHICILHHYRACADLRLGTHTTGSLVLDQETMKDAAMMKYRRAVVSSRIVTQYRNYLERGTGQEAIDESFGPL